MKCLNIFGKELKVEVKDTGHPEYEGLFYPDSFHIEISETSHGKDSIFFHEFFHAVWFRCGFNQAQIPLAVQELIVENFSVAIIENLPNIINNLKELEMNKKKIRK